MKVSIKWILLLTVFYWLILVVYGSLFSSTKLENAYYGLYFTTAGIVDSENRNVGLNEVLKSKFTIIDYWFLGCKPCIREMQSFPELLDKNEDVNIFSVARDFDYAWEAGITPYNLFGIHENWKHLRLDLDNNKSPKAYLNEKEIEYFPTYLLMDKQGKILKTSNKIHEVFMHKNSNLPNFIYNIKEFLLSPFDLLTAILKAVILSILTILLFGILTKHRSKRAN